MNLEFIPVTESKKTIEKKVKEKPKLRDLTTVEYPGRPVPASYLEEDKAIKKKTKRRTKAKASEKETKISQPQRDSIVIITEKPQAAFKIASALGTARKYSENNVPYYELKRDNKKIIVACAVGHLFTLTSKEKGFPVFNISWNADFKKNPWAKRYYSLLKKLVKNASEYIISTDFDVEGE